MKTTQTDLVYIHQMHLIQYVITRLVTKGEKKGFQSSAFKKNKRLDKT